MRCADDDDDDADDGALLPPPGNEPATCGNGDGVRDGCRNNTDGASLADAALPPPRGGTRAPSARAANVVDDADDERDDADADAAGAAAAGDVDGNDCETVSDDNGGDADAAPAVVGISGAGEADASAGLPTRRGVTGARGAALSARGMRFSSPVSTSTAAPLPVSLPAGLSSNAAARSKKMAL